MLAELKPPSNSVSLGNKDTSQGSRKCHLRHRNQNHFNESFPVKDWLSLKIPPDSIQVPIL